MLAGWSILDTIAGEGDKGDKGENNWRDRDEGARATTVDLSRPHIAMADTQGNVYIADKDAHGVRMVRPDGTIVTVAGTSRSWRRRGWRGDRQGAVVPQRALGAPGWHVVCVGPWEPEGSQGRPAGQMTTLFEVPSGGSGRGLWVSEDETGVRHAGTTLYVWDKATGVRALADGFRSLANVHVGPRGQLGVADRDDSRVWLVDRQTGAKTPYAGDGTTDAPKAGALALESGLHEVRGLWFHPEGGALVATHKGGKVWYVDDAGALTLVLDGDDDRDTHGGDGQRFDSPGKNISEPRAVTMTPWGSARDQEQSRVHPLHQGHPMNTLDNALSLALTQARHTRRRRRRHQPVRACAARGHRTGASAASALGP